MHDSILITGGAGFVGSNLAVCFKERYPKTRVIVMDNLKRRGSEMNLKRLKDAGVEFFHGDIRCPDDFPRVEYSAIIECSAEPSVLAGFDGNPLYVVNTNLSGTVNCLEEARKRKADVIFLSTSRVYPHDVINKIDVEDSETRFVWASGQTMVGWSEKGISEKFPMEGPRSLYGASKLCSELILQEYISMYGIRGVINRCGVIAGPWQFGKVDQGVFTHWMLAHYFKKDNLKYIGFGGQGKQVRDLMHVDDLFGLVECELLSMNEINGLTFNVGGGREISLSLAETTGICNEITGNAIPVSSDGVTRPADLKIYITDNTLVTEKTGWLPRSSARKILEDTFNWIKEHEPLIKNTF